MKVLKGTTVVGRRDRATFLLMVETLLTNYEGRHPFPERSEVAPVRVIINSVRLGHAHTHGRTNCIVPKRGPLYPARNCYNSLRGRPLP